MPWAPLRVCPTHRLRLPVGKRCPACAAAYDRTRPPTHYQVLTGREWRLLRAQVLAEEPWCTTPGCDQPSTEVDHVIPRKARPDLTYLRTNLQALCAPCHGRKTRQEKSPHVVKSDGN